MGFFPPDCGAEEKSSADECICQQVNVNFSWHHFVS